jgi:hypothetical protein
MADLKFSAFNAYLAVWLLIFLSFACAETEETGDITIIEIEKNIGNFNPFKLSDLDCEIEYVVLETTDEAMLMDIRFLDLSGRHIVITDRDNCYLFDRGGKFISKIGSQGRGPGENMFFTQIKILNDKIFLPNVTLHELNIFNTKGKFLNTVKSPGRFSAIESINWMPLSDSSFLVQIPNDTGVEEYRIAHINFYGEIIKKYANTTFFNCSHEGCLINRRAEFYTHNDIIYYKELLNDTIWQLKDNFLKPEYILSLGKFGFSFEHKALSYPVYLEKVHEGIFAKKVFGFQDYIFLNLDFMQHYPFDFRESYFNPLAGDRTRNYDIIGMYNKLTEEFSLVAPSNIDDQIEPTGLENDIDGGINFLPKYAADDTLIVSWFEPYQLKMYVASETFKNSTPKYPEKKKELEELAASLDENDNPVLMLVKLTK